MKKFKVGDVVRIVGGSSRKWKIDSFAEGKAWIVFRRKLDYGRQLIELKDIVLVDPQADMKQAIREVLLSDEFMTAFAAAFLSATVPRLTLEDLIPGVNRPMRNEAQLLKMVEMVRQPLTTEANWMPMEMSSDMVDHRQRMTDHMSNLTLLCKEAKTDAVSLAMKIACERFGGSDGVFNGAGFSGAIRTLSGLNFDLDGFIVATILCGRNDVEVLKGCSHYRHLQTESTEIKSNCPEIPDGSNPSEIPNSSSEPWVPKVGERVRLTETGDIYEIESYSEIYAQYSMQGWPGSCVDLEDIEPANPSEIPKSSSEPTPKPSKTQPPSDYRMLGSAKDEPRQASDLYWSLSAKNWIPIKLNQVEYANRDDWVACRKIEVTSSPPKRYRDPTKDDVKNGPIECEYRDDDEQWRSGLLVYVLNWDQPFLCVNKERGIGMAYQWKQCRIEVTG